MKKIGKERIYETKKYILATSEEMDNGWKLYYYIDKSEISEQIREIMATTVLVIGLCLAVALIMMSVISKNFKYKNSSTKTWGGRD